jgi:hypothetical protein
MSEFKSSSFRNEDNSGAPDIVGVTSFTSPFYFVPPSGTTAQRPSGDGLAPGMLRFNTDIGRLEVWRGDHWATILGNAITFGNLSTSRRGLSACGSATRGLFMGAAGASSQRIDFITYSSTGDATTFGTLSTNKEGNGALSSSTRAISFGGDNVGSGTNVIEYMTIASTSNGIDFGDLLSSQTTFTGGIASSTRGVIGGGNTYPSEPQTNVIQYITISTLGNSIDFGDLTTPKGGGTATSNSTRGIFIGGVSGPSRTNTIEYVTIASTGNAQDFGDLTNATNSFAACSSSTRALYGGGSAPTTTNTIEYITILSAGNAVDFGDLTIARFSLGACSNAHGGL